MYATFVFCNIILKKFRFNGILEYNEKKYIHIYFCSSKNKIIEIFVDVSKIKSLKYPVGVLLVPSVNAYDRKLNTVVP